jgi:23S rRNA pseudouridine1911/1915/1917 synthase
MDWTVNETVEIGERFDKHLAGRLPEMSRSRLQDLIKDGHATLNGRPVKPGATMRAGDVVSVTVPEVAAVEIKAQDIPLTILYQDADIVVLDKSSGLVVHPAEGNADGTLVNALLHHIADLSGIGGEMRPGIVHRLDKDTSGCMVVAKNDTSHRRLTEAFSERRLTKIYLAVVNGVPKEESGRIQNFIGRHPVDRKRMSVLLDGAGKEAVTEWQRLAVDQGCALIQCRLLTGRTHQIRVHMRETLQSPILGDPIYAQPTKQRVRVPRLMLHAWKLAFNHPIHDQPMAFETKLPPEFEPWMKCVQS